MILAHSLVGILPIEDGHISWFFFSGSVIPDVDHIFVIIKHRIFAWRKLLDTVRFEDRYNIRYKTPYMHSLLGAIVMSLIVYFLNPIGAQYFFVGYVLHLFLDWPDIDEKLYLFPLRIPFRGFLPIISIPEIVFTLLLLLLNVFLFLH